MAIPQSNNLIAHTGYVCNLQKLFLSFTWWVSPVSFSSIIYVIQKEPEPYLSSLYLGIIVSFLVPSCDEMKPGVDKDGSANWYRTMYWTLTLQCPGEFLADTFLALNLNIREGMKSDPEITRTSWNFASFSSLPHAMSLGNSACLIRTFAVHYASWKQVFQQNSLNSRDGLQFSELQLSP